MSTYEPDLVASAAQAPPAPQPPAAPAAPAVEVAPPSRYKNPALAAFLSLFPGIGNLYNGLYMRGLAFFLICASMVFLVAEEPGPLFGMAIPFFWIFNMVDAYRQATLINHGYGTDLGVDEPPKLASASQGGMMVGVILFLIGTVALLEQLNLRINLDWLVDLWPIFLMGIGGWLIFDTVRDKARKAAEAEEAEI
jgi:TM2 domain-containing membrane protein YozV